ncbi:MAG: hypothetical protein JNG83_14970 [Opitutaceae bacterium]|nr:hypothetical protein [Opitutaceae bacterium]
MILTLPRPRRAGLRPAGRLLALVVALAAGSAGAAVTHLFAFDDRTLPYKENLQLTFATPRKHPANPVLAPGPAGSVDATRAQFYGSVLRIDGRFRMWYSAIATSELRGNQATTARLAYAESADGVRWTKPELGLTEFNGSRRNNLLGMPAQLDFGRIEPLACFVLHEPEDPDPARRYKMAVYGRYYPSAGAPTYPGVPAGNVPSTIYPFFSADGLSWRLAVPCRGSAFDETEAPIPVRNNFELGGLYKFDGIYYAAGQELSPDIYLPDGSLVRRTMVTHWSGDFVHWSREKSFSFQRHGYRGPRESFQEAHEPAGVWNRGDVLIGLYGLWQGAVITSERRMDLGFLVSNDGVHFREPVADHAFLRAGRDGEWDQRGLIHGQGYHNVGDETYLYYGNWDLSGDRAGPGSGAVGLAVLPRDRLAHLALRDAGGGSCTSRPLPNRGPVTLYLNADGLAEEARLRIELIDRLGAPVPGYAGAEAAIVRESGLKVAVRWPQGTAITCPQESYRLRFTFEGAEAGRVRFYAGYLE